DGVEWVGVEATNGWTPKRTKKLMMMAEAYQMASAFDDNASAKADPENRYLWRFRPQRLDAEIVRDSMLAVGGNINLAIGGEPIFPYIPKEILARQYRGQWLNTQDGSAASRRGAR